MSSDATRHTTGKAHSGPGSERMTSLRRQTTSSKQGRFRIAILDDYQDVALSLADWTVGSDLFLDLAADGPVTMAGVEVGRDLSLLDGVFQTVTIELTKPK